MPTFPLPYIQPAFNQNLHGRSKINKEATAAKSFAPKYKAVNWLTLEFISKIGEHCLKIHWIYIKIYVVTVYIEFT